MGHSQKILRKLNDKQQLMVHFEKGEMSENAEVFQVNKVPFEKGIQKVKLESDCSSSLLMEFYRVH